MPKVSRLIIIAGLVLIVAACADQPAPPAPPPELSVPGFWIGIWHGMIVPFAFIGSLFTDVRMYAFPNNGPWYDFGFLFGMSIWGSGPLSMRRWKKKRRENTVP